MPSTAVRTFSDPDDYAASIRGTSAEMTVVGRGHFKAKLTQIELHRLRMQRFSDNLPRIAHSAAVIWRAIINFRLLPGPSMLANGVELEPTSIIRHSDGLDAFQRSSGSACWGSMSLPVEENPDRALYIPELAAEIAVSLSTLRVCCEEQLGMSPKRYLMLRRMHFVRRALLDSAPGTSTVTKIATRYGFFELGRFAGQYGSLFGESPSATLRRPRDSGVTGPSDFPNFC